MLWSREVDCTPRIGSLTNREEAKARRATEIATIYVDRARQLAAEQGISPARLGHQAVEAYRQILEKHKSRLDGAKSSDPAIPIDEQ